MSAAAPREQACIGAAIIKVYPPRVLSKGTTDPGKLPDPLALPIPPYRVKVVDEADGANRAAAVEELGGENRSVANLLAVAKHLFVDDREAITGANVTSNCPSDPFMSFTWRLEPSTP